MPRRSWAVTVDDPEWPVVPFEVRETDAVEIATEQMRVSSAKSAALLFRLRWSFVCSRCRYGYGLALGGYRQEADRS